MRAGLPTAKALAGMSDSTTEFAPITARLPMVMPPRIFAPAEAVTQDGLAVALA